MTRDLKHSDCHESVEEHLPSIHMVLGPFPGAPRGDRNGK